MVVAGGAVMVSVSVAELLLVLSPTGLVTVAVLTNDPVAAGLSVPFRMNVTELPAGNAKV